MKRQLSNLLFYSALMFLYARTLNNLTSSVDKCDDIVLSYQAIEKSCTCSVFSLPHMRTLNCTLATACIMQAVLPSNKNISAVRKQTI